MADGSLLAASLGELRSEADLLARDGLPPLNDLRPTIALTRGLIDLFTDGRDRRAIRAVAFAQQVLDRSLERHPGKRVACTKGCSHCCANFIAASIPEVLAVAAQVRAQSAGGHIALDERLSQAVSDGRDWAGARRATITMPCPLLVDHACSVYPGRPLACRGYASTEVAVCIRALTDPAVTIPTPNSYVFFRTRITTALWAALKAVGLPYVSYDLNRALVVALAEPDVERRWLAGEDVFAEVTVDRTRPPDVEPFLDQLIAEARGRS